MNGAEYKWDFFIAHASADSDTADALYKRLAPRARTFLDTRCIELGADWDVELARAQREALISVVLVSSRSGQAYYQREEIAAAIEMARADAKRHRVVPVFLSDASIDVPYGLKLKHGLTLSNKFGPDEAAESLLGLLTRLQHSPGAPPFTPPDQRRWWRQVSVLWIGAGLAGVVALGASGWFLSGTLRTAQPNGELPQPPHPKPVALTKRNCVKIEFFSPNVIPHYLLNSIGSENFPYWLRVKATNECQTDRNIKVRFESSGVAGALENPPQSQPFTVVQGETVDRTFNPVIDLVAKQPERIQIFWSIEDEDGTKIREDSIRAEIVAPLTIAWDLEKPDESGKRVPVEREFLLASLQAWTKKPPSSVVDVGRKCRTKPGGVLREGVAAIAACYRYMFHDKKTALVSDSLISFPASTRQHIRSPVQLIEDPFNPASSLEAALLFVAVIEAKHKDDVDPPPVLIVAPLQSAAASELKTAFFAWHEASKPWRAFDLRLANEQDFESNVAAASARVAAIFGEYPEVVKDISNTGVALSKDARVAAVNFRKVPQKYRISGLP